MKLNKIKDLRETIDSLGESEEASSKAFDEALNKFQLDSSVFVHHSVKATI